MAHVINKLLVEINCSHEEQALNMRHNFFNTFQQRITDIMQKVCDKYVNETENLQLDKLEIDLGQHSTLAFDSEFDALFSQKFEQQLSEQLAVISSTQRANSAQRSSLELLACFLQKGILPWWATETTINLDEISSNLLSNNKAAIRDFLWKKRYDPVVWQRIAFQLNEQAQQVIIVLFEELTYAVTLLNELVQQLIRTLTNSNQNNVASAAMDKLNNIADEPVKLITANAPVIFNTIKNTANTRIALASFIANQFEAGKEEYNLVMAAINKVVSGVKLAYTTEVNTISNQLKGYQVAEAQTDAYNNLEGKEVAEKWLVKQAGIVLLAPFLKPFFTNLQLWQMNEWKNKNAQHKAVHLLSYLGNGKQKPVEYQLVLEKVIGGIPLEEPLPATVHLSDIEIQEAENLLRAVIEHWKVLKNTSVNGLRESFLKRDGILTATENGWLLQLERKTIDVLLDSIPWSYSTIQLPWNNYTLTTMW